MRIKYLLMMAALTIVAFRFEWPGALDEMMGRFAGIDLSLLHPIQQRVRRAADLCRYRLTGTPAGGMVSLVIQNHPHRSLTHLS